MADASSCDTTSDCYNESLSEMFSEKNACMIIGQKPEFPYYHKNKHNFVDKLFTREVSKVNSNFAMPSVLRMFNIFVTAFLFALFIVPFVLERLLFFIHCAGGDIIFLGHFPLG